MSQAFGRLMVESGRGGSIVNISSIAGKRLAPFTAAYAASKAGLQALTACMAQEVAGAGVRVNADLPGAIDTSRMDDLGRDEGWQQLVRTHVPLGRAGTGEDIAHIVVYLCSDEGAWVTGQSWNVDGGERRPALTVITLSRLSHPESAPAGICCTATNPMSGRMEP